MQQLMQENEELRKRLDAMRKSQPSPRVQQVPQVQQDELGTSSWEPVPSRTTPTTPTTYEPPDKRCEQSHSWWNSTSGWTAASRQGGEGSHAAAIASSAAYAIGRLRGVQSSGGQQMAGTTDVSCWCSTRVQRLEQELKDLREALTMRRLPGQEPLGAYGAQPFQRVGPPSADPSGAQQTLHQACDDINMRGWVHVNGGNPYLHQQGQPIAGNQLGQQGGQFGNPYQCAGQHQGGGNCDPRTFLGGGVRDDRPREEELKPVTITLPELPELGGQNQGLEAGDWMAQIRPQIADVSHRAMWWWDTLVTMTTQRYQQCLGHDPITRLNVQPPAVEKLPQGFTRLEQRVTSLLMQAIPKTLAAKMIANRQLGAVQIIFKVMKVYQAGGLGEHQNTLQALTATQPAGMYLEASTSLRMWQRHHSRAEELGAMVPDPTLMVGALDKILSKLLQGNPQANFRLSAFRMGGHRLIPSQQLPRSNNYIKCYLQKLNSHLAAQRCLVKHKEGLR